jgi:hypothetical protein
MPLCPPPGSPPACGEPSPISVMVSRRLASGNTAQTSCLKRGTAFAHSALSSRHYTTYSDHGFWCVRIRPPPGSPPACGEPSPISVMVSRRLASGNTAQSYGSTHQIARERASELSEERNRIRSLCALESPLHDLQRHPLAASQVRSPSWFLADSPQGTRLKAMARSSKSAAERRRIGTQQGEAVGDKTVNSKSSIPECNSATR